MSNNQTTKEFMVDEIKKWIFRTTMLALVALVVFLFAPTQKRLERIWETPAKLEAIETQLASISVALAALSGENRVIAEIPGLSYVKEPVYIGDDITLYTTLRRTALGEQCILQDRTALFADETNIPIAGETVRPSQQVGTEATTIRMVLRPPRGLRTGRVLVKMSLHFTCGTRTVYDTTTPVAFTLLDKPTGRQQ